MNQQLASLGVEPGRSSSSRTGLQIKPSKPTHDLSYGIRFTGQGHLPRFRISLRS